MGSDLPRFFILNDDPAVFAVTKDQVNISGPDAVTLTDFPTKLELVHDCLSID